MDRRAQCGTVLRVLGVLLGNRSDRYQFSAGPLSLGPEPDHVLVWFWSGLKKIKKSHTKPKPHPNQAQFLPEGKKGNNAG